MFSLVFAYSHGRFWTIIAQYGKGFVELRDTPHSESHRMVRGLCAIWYIAVSAKRNFIFSSTTASKMTTEDIRGIKHPQSVWNFHHRCSPYRLLNACSASVEVRIMFKLGRRGGISPSFSGSEVESNECSSSRPPPSSNAVLYLSN